MTMASLLELEADLPERRGYVDARRRAQQVLRERGLPGAHGVEERYRQIDLRPVLERPWRLVGQGDATPGDRVQALMARVPDAVHWRIVTINGLVAPELCQLPGTVTWRPGSEAPDQGESRAAALESLYEENPFVAANVLLGPDTIELEIADGAAVMEPIGMIHLGVGVDDGVLAPRVALTVGRGASATLLECWFSDCGALRLPVTQVELEQGAHLCLLRLQEEDAQAVHVGATVIRATGEATVFDGLALDFGAVLHRHDVYATVAGPEQRLTWNGLALIGDRQVNDIHARVVHRAAGSESNQMYKIVLDDRAHGIFSGRIVVEQAAQQTSAFQASPAVLLSDDARLQTNPELEIYADDVRCTHGATCGELDEEAMFYLRARGLDRSTAEAMLLYGFVQEVLEGWEGELRDELERRITEQMQRVHGVAPL